MSDLSLPSNFLEFSSVLGAKRLLVQGPGGNTSLKSDGSLFIKASGMELADANKRKIFVEVDLAAARAEIDSGGDGSCIGAVIDKSPGLRPSIETTFHALLPQKFVFHYHSVNSLVYSASIQGRKLLDQVLDGLNWVTIPYRKPGLDLTLEIRKAIKAGVKDIFILENHGVIVASDSVSNAIDQVTILEKRLNQQAIKYALPATQESIPELEGWKVAQEFSALAQNSTMHAHAVSGSYYPDHVVFLGPALLEITVDQISQLKDLPVSSPAILVRDKGVLLKKDANASQISMLQCLLDFLVRVPENWELIPISTEAEKELLNWDAEKYRQKLSGALNGPD